MRDYNFNNDNKFKIYGGYEKLNYGSEAKIDVSVYPERNNLTEDIQKLLEVENLEELLEELKAEEKQVYDKIYESMNEWIEKAKLTKVCLLALDYKKQSKENEFKANKHSNNKWVDAGNWQNAREISNNVYKMNYSIYETTNYNYKTHKDEKVYYVTWDVYITGVESKNIAGQRNKRYNNEESALKYIEGRKKAFSHLFKEINPVIPKEHENLFKVNGILLPDYVVEQ